MSGHSKWANIKHKKSRQDDRRGRVFTKIGREIAVAVKEGGPDPETNSKLKDVIAKAKSNNMPNDNIERSIKKAAGTLSSINYEAVVYEGYGVGGVAVIVESLTDNRNRTAAEVRHIFDKNGGSLGETGCVSWMFDNKGVIVIEKNDGIDEEELMMAALEAGAEDVAEEDGFYEITTEPSVFGAVRERMEKAGYDLLSAETTMLPNNTMDVSPKNETTIKKLLDALEEDDDIQNIYHNAKFNE